MNNLENRRNKINSCMAELFNLYMEDRKNIKGSISLDGVKCTLTFGETSKKKITDKKVMTIKDLKGIAIHCKTREESDNFLKKADSFGLKWGISSPCKTIILENWETYKEETCYCINDEDFGLEYDDVEYFKERKYTIKPAKWFFDNFTPKE